MLQWVRSDVTVARLNGLVVKGLLHPLLAGQEWIIPRGKPAPVLPAGYVISFIDFCERRFTMPAHSFFRGLLHHNGVELQHLNPNGVKHISAFIALCEGYLGVPPIFNLWRYFFSTSLIQTKINGVPTSHPVGCASIHLNSGSDCRSQQYIEMEMLKTSNKGCHASWCLLVLP